MSENTIRALKYEVGQVGKHIKSTKKRYFWSLSIRDRFYNFILDHSVLTTKSKLSINGKIFHQTEEGALARCTYHHSFIIDGCVFNIVESKGAYEMRINNTLFSHMLLSEMGSNQFQEHKVEDNSFQLSDKIRPGESKKITLNLPGMGNGMKKKKCTGLESDNWNQFAGSTNFPNYFGQSEPQVAKTITPKVEIEPLVPCDSSQQKESPNCSFNPIQQQFSTLQNLFKTISDCGKYVLKTPQGVTPTYDIGQIPTIPEINLEEFNTMQNLFSTINNTQPPLTPQPKVEEMPQAKLGDFSTMQRLFATLQFTQELKKQSKVDQPIVRAEQFNTMQNLFNTLQQPVSSLSSAVSISLTTQAPQELSNVNINDFSTLQNLFATGFTKPNSTPAQKMLQNLQQFKTIQCICPSPFQSQSLPPSQQNTDFSKINLNDFNTMQNLFATNSVNGLKEILCSTDKANTVEFAKKKVDSVPNQLDFNTMQHLFATNAFPNSKIEKKENNFWQF